MEYTNKPTPLCNLGYKYGTDKCPQIKHAYTPFYYELFRDKRESVRKFMEIGIGYTRKNSHRPEVIYERGIKRYLKRGASLYMWRDFFPKAQIFGADMRLGTMFEAERIKTYLCDEREKADLVQLINTVGTDIDVVLDDASHHVGDQILAAQTLLPMLEPNVIYIIEDVNHSKWIAGALGTGYEYYKPTIYRKWKGSMILVITNKKQNGIK